LPLGVEFSFAEIKVQWISLGGGGLQIPDYPGNNAGISVDGLGKFTCQGVFLGTCLCLPQRLFSSA